MLAAFAPAFTQSIPAPTNSAPDVVSVRIIVLSTAAAAEEIIQRVKAGESFAALARALSIDPTAGSGGLLSGISRSALRAELRDAVQGLQPGQTSGVVRVPTGFAVIELATDDDGQSAAQPATAATGLNPAVSAEDGVKYGI